MGKVTRFEELECWQRARALVRAVYGASEDGALSKDFALKDQLRRAALSVMTNIAEGFARYHRREFIRFLDIAQSSAVEVQSLLYVVEDRRYLLPDATREIRDLAKETEKVTLGLLRYLHRRSDEGRSGKVRDPEGPYSYDEPFSAESLQLPNNFIDVPTQ